jgi:hypothetical protein
VDSYLIRGLTPTYYENNYVRDNVSKNNTPQLSKTTTSSWAILLSCDTPPSRKPLTEKCDPGILALSSVYLATKEVHISSLNSMGLYSIDQ